MNGHEQQVCFAIAGLVVIECVALSQGIDGTLMSVVVASVAALGGYSAAKSKTISRFIEQAPEDY